MNNLNHIYNNMLLFVDRCFYWTGRCLRATTSIWHELLISAIRPKDWIFFCKSCYAKNKSYKLGVEQPPLFEWEATAIANFFPEPPAHVFVLAAGTGRELVHLAHMGYQLSGLEPIESFALNSKKVVHNNLLNFLTCSFDKYCEQTHTQAQFTCDAAIISYGSLSHVAKYQQRLDLLVATTKACPTGPILISWLAYRKLPRWRRKLRVALRKVGLKHQKFGNYYASSVGPWHGYTTSEILNLFQKANLEILYNGINDSYCNAVVKAK